MKGDTSGEKSGPKLALLSGPAALRMNQIIYLLAAALILNAFLTHAVESRTGVTLKSGDRLPDYSFTLSDGASLGPEAIKGAPAIYFFYAGWCPCSHQSVSQIVRAHGDYGGEGLKVVAVGIQDADDDLARFANKFSLPFPAAIAGGEEVARAVGVATTPTTLFVDEQGVIRAYYVGRLDKYEQLDDGLASILPGKAAKAGARP